MSIHNTKILVVEDEARHARVLTINLEIIGYNTSVANDGLTAIQMTASENPDLILLDIGLPGIDGYEVCRRIREFSNVPIIMLTASRNTNAKVQGLESGADDYITKPFIARELLARVKAALRRPNLENPPPCPIIEIGDLKVDFVSQRVYLGHGEIKLTRIEYRLLSTLIKNSGRLLMSDDLLDEVWGLEYDHGNQLLWQAIHRLRKKIEPDPPNPIYIHNRTGMGYLFEYREPSDDYQPPKGPTNEPSKENQ